VKGRRRELTKSGDSGFALMELMISIVVLSLIVLGAAGLMSGVGSGTRNSQGNTFAAELLQQKVEELRSRPFDHADLSAGTHTQTYPTLSRTVSWIVQDDVAGELKRADLKVTWVEGKKSRQLGFRLHLANRSAD
jgi:prepilin-type N-terminal cleavage/methylation domain-containing protein